MTYFNFIKTAHEANSYMNVKRREKKTLSELVRHMTQFGCLLIEGKFQQIFEVSPTSEITAAEIRPEGFISAKSIIRKEGCLYYYAWSEESLKRDLHFLKPI